MGTGTPTGLSIPLSAVTKLIPTVGPLQVNHQGQQPSVTISFNLAPGVVARRRGRRDPQASSAKSNLPPSITTGFQGNAQVFQESLKGQGILVLAAIFAAFVVLGILYESFIHPITIISGLPSAGIGALLTLMLFNMDLSVIAMIGIVMLVGIVKKNAIMMIDFALERRRVGVGAEAAIREACLLRFRPIMMTTFAAIFGALPIALGTGAGAELRQPLGIAVVGGLCVSQLLTLYITPVIYLYLDRIDRMLKRRLEPQLAGSRRARRAGGGRGGVAVERGPARSRYRAFLAPQGSAADIVVERSRRLTPDLPRPSSGLPRRFRRYKMLKDTRMHTGNLDGQAHAPLLATHSRRGRSHHAGYGCDRARHVGRSG